MACDRHSAATAREFPPRPRTCRTAQLRCLVRIFALATLTDLVSCDNVPLLSGVRCAEGHSLRASALYWRQGTSDTLRYNNGVMKQVYRDGKKSPVGCGWISKASNIKLFVQQTEGPLGPQTAAGQPAGRIFECNLHENARHNLSSDGKFHYSSVFPFYYDHFTGWDVCKRVKLHCVNNAGDPFYKVLFIDDQDKSDTVRHRLNFYTQEENESYWYHFWSVCEHQAPFVFQLERRPAPSTRLVSLLPLRVCSRVCGRA